MCGKQKFSSPIDLSQVTKAEGARNGNSSRIASLSIYRWIIARSEFTDSRSSFTASQVGGVLKSKGSKVPEYRDQPRDL